MYVCVLRLHVEYWAQGRQIKTWEEKKISNRFTAMYMGQRVSLSCKWTQIVTQRLLKFYSPRRPASTPKTILLVWQDWYMALAVLIRLRGKVFSGFLTITWPPTAGAPGHASNLVPRVSGMTYLWLAYSYSKHPIVTGNAFPLSNEFFSCLEYKLMSVHKVVWNGTPIWSSFTDVLQGMQVREHLCRCAFFRQVYVSYFCTNPS